MSLFAALGRLFARVGRMLGLAGATTAGRSPAQPPAMCANPIAAPAVAGFVKRAPIDRFLLARRLASVARLNTPHGRKPWIKPSRPAHLPPVPTARLGAKRLRIDANQGRRILLGAAPPAAAPRSNVIPFPADAARVRAGKLARAA